MRNLKLELVYQSSLSQSFLARESSFTLRQMVQEPLIARAVFPNKPRPF